MAWGTTVSLNENAICALKLLCQHFMRASFALVPAPKLTGGAADAWANETVAGLGGWACFGGRLQWFHLELRREMIPKDWNWPESMQRGISSLELLAQLALLSMSVSLAGKQGSIQVCFRQRSDNMPTVGVVAKGLCTAYPLGAALQTLAYACLGYECDLDVAHIAGERNEKADKASRLNEGQVNLPHEFQPSNRWSISADELFRPWYELMRSWRSWRDHVALFSAAASYVKPLALLWGWGLRLFGDNCLFGGVGVVPLLLWGVGPGLWAGPPGLFIQRWKKLPLVAWCCCLDMLSRDVVLFCAQRQYKLYLSCIPCLFHVLHAMTWCHDAMSLCLPVSCYWQSC